MKDGQQQMLFFYRRSGLHARLENGQFENIAGLLVEHQLMVEHVVFVNILAYLLLQLAFYRPNVNAIDVQHLSHSTVLVTQDAKEQMLWSDRRTFESCRFLPAEGKNL